jgi:hypothetical protein
MREREPAEKLARSLKEWAQTINTTFSATLEDPGQAGALLDDECRISMRAFMTKRGGPYVKESKAGSESIADDEAIVRSHELAYSGAREEWAKAHYGTQDEEEMLTQYRAAEKRRAGTLAEGAIVCVLNKFLGERYAVVRTALFDDHEQGVDMLILDKQNGGVVCAFDEVVGLEGDERHTKKVERARGRLAKHGGMQVKYGLSFERERDGAVKLKRKSMPHIPGFCTSLSHGDLQGLLRRAQFTQTGTAVPEELATFEGMISALKEQSRLGKLTDVQHKHISELIAYCEQLPAVSERVVY